MGETPKSVIAPERRQLVNECLVQVGIMGRIKNAQTHQDIASVREELLELRFFGRFSNQGLEPEEVDYLIGLLEKLIDKAEARLPSVPPEAQVHTVPSVHPTEVEIPRERLLMEKVAVVKGLYEQAIAQKKLLKRDDKHRIAEGSWGGTVLSHLNYRWGGQTGVSYQGQWFEFNGTKYRSTPARIWGEISQTGGEIFLNVGIFDVDSVTVDDRHNIDISALPKPGLRITVFVANKYSHPVWLHEDTLSNWPSNFRPGDKLFGCVSREDQAAIYNDTIELLSALEITLRKLTNPNQTL